jgi:hypothetical protein
MQNFKKIANRKRMRSAIELMKNTHLSRVSGDYPHPSQSGRTPMYAHSSDLRMPCIWTFLFIPQILAQGIGVKNLFEINRLGGAYSGDSGHPFRSIPATCSDPFRPPPRGGDAGAKKMDFLQIEWMILGY